MTMRKMMEEILINTRVGSNQKHYKHYYKIKDMKKVLLVLFVAALGMSSCKKDEVAQPVKTVQNDDDEEDDGGDINQHPGWE